MVWSPGESTTVAPRALAPDLARGAMLALIAIANVSWYLWAAPSWPGSIHPTDGNLLDRALQALIIVTVDMRIYPMFAFLLGYGMVQFVDARARRGHTELQARRLLRRRHWIMILIGTLHAALLWFGDVVAAYGMAGLVMTFLFFRRRDKTLLIWSALIAVAFFGLAVLTGLAGVLAARAGVDTPEDAGVATARYANALTSYPASVVERLETWWVIALVQGLLTGVIPICILLGWVAARHRLLERPGPRLRLLRVVAVGGIAIGWLGGVPMALLHLEVWPEARAVWWAFLLPHLLTGACAGLGYAALFGLLAHRFQQAARPPGPAVRSVAALGRRSLSGYLLQSIVLAPLLCAWGIGLGGRIGTTAAVAIAVLTWLLSVVLADRLERTGRSGPFEVLLRRVIDRAAAPAP